jgi:hypothetical protein
LNLGSSINHQSLIGAGTITHTTIDSYLDQAVKTTSSPTFYRQNVLGSTLGSGVISPYIRWGPGGAGYTRNSASLDFTYISAGHSSNNASISLHNCDPSIKFIEEGVVISPTTISTSSTTGALVVRGGVGIAGDVYIASNKHLVFPTESSIKKIILSHDGTGSYNYRGFGTKGTYMLYNIDSSSASHVFMSGNGETMANTLVQISGNLAAGGLRVFHTTASTSSTTGALTVAGGVGIGGAIFGGSSIRAATDCGLILTSDIDANTQAGSYCNLSTVDNIGVHWNRIVSGVNNAYEMTVSSTGELNIYNRSIGNYSIQINNTGLTKLSAGTFIYDGPKTDSTSSTTGVCRIDGGCGITKSVNIGARVTALNMTCSTAPTLDTDIVRKIDLTSYSPTGAIHITDTTDSTSTNTGALIVDGGIGIAKNAYIGGYLNAAASAKVSGSLELFNNTDSHQIKFVGSHTDGMGTLVANSYITFDYLTNLTISDARVKVASTEDSTSISSGSIITSGGLACAKSVYVGNSIVAGINATDEVSMTSFKWGSTNSASPRNYATMGFNFTSSGAAANYAYIGLGASESMKFLGTYTRSELPFKITDSTASSSTTSGALLVNGGAGIAGQVTSLTSKVTSTTDSTSTSTGALVVSGGIACAKAICAANYILPTIFDYEGGFTDDVNIPETIKHVYMKKIDNICKLFSTESITHKFWSLTNMMYLADSDGDQLFIPSAYRPPVVVYRTIIVDTSVMKISILPGGPITIHKLDESDFDVGVTTHIVWPFMIEYAI